MLQRFQLLVWPDAPRKWLNIDRFPDNGAKRRVYKIYQGLDALSFTNNKQEPSGLRFSPDAQDLFDEWRNELELKLREGHFAPALESHLAKYRSLMPSLALIFYLVECIDKNLELSVVSIGAAHQAIKWLLLIPFFSIAN